MRKWKSFVTPWPLGLFFHCDSGLREFVSCGQNDGHALTFSLFECSVS